MQPFVKNLAMGHIARSTAVSHCLTCVCVCVCVTVLVVSVEEWKVTVAVCKVKYRPRRWSELSESRDVLSVASLSHSCTAPLRRRHCLRHHRSHEDFSWTSKPPYNSCPLLDRPAVHSLRPLPTDDLQMTLAE